jgi:hypothetical protein
VASERGLTTKARLLLNTIATDLSITPQEFQEWLEQLLQRSPREKTSVSEELQTFRDLLRVQFEASATKILTAKQEQTLLQLAVNDLHLPLESTREELREHAQQYGLKRVTREEADRYVLELLDQKVGDAETLDAAVYQRLYAFAHDWGLDAAVVESLIHERLEHNFRQRRAETMRTRWLLGGAGVIFAVVICGLIMRAIFPPTAKPIVHVPADSTEELVEVPRNSPRVKPPAWWNADLAVAANAARNEVPEFTPIFAAMVADDPQRRVEGYSLWIEQLAHTDTTAPKQQLLLDMFGPLYGFEPSETAAAQLRTQAIAVVQQTIDRVPTQSSQYAASIRLLDQMVHTLESSSVPENRLAELRTILERLAQCALPANNSDNVSRARSHVAILMLSKLGDVLAARPEVLTQHYAYLASLAREQAGDLLAERQATLVAQAIRLTPRSYHSWKNLAIQGLEVRGTLPLLQILEAWETCDDSTLRDDLAPRLLVRAGLSPQGIPQAEIPQRIRAALGVGEQVASHLDNKTEDWEQQLNRLLEKRTRPPETAVEQLEALVEVAWHVNVALLLAREGAQSPRFQAVLKQGSPVVAATPREASGENPETESKANAQRLSYQDQQTLERYALELSEPETLAEPKRASNLRGLAHFAEQLADIAPSQARSIAKYLVFAVGEEEQTQRFSALPRLRRWRTLRLAVADELEQQPRLASVVAPIALRLAGRELTDEPISASNLRRFLLESVLQELNYTFGPTTKLTAHDVMDRWESELNTLYGERAQWLGSPLPTDSKSHAAELLEESATRLRPVSLLVDSTDRWQRVAAITAQSNLQRTVYAQQSLIERTAQATLARYPAKRPTIERVLNTHWQRSTATGSAVLQLREGEFTMLELWRLWKS